MIKFLQQLIILWEKKKFLTLIEMESQYIIRQKKDILGKDLSDLRGRLAKLRAIKNAKNETQREIISIEAEINEAEKHRQMVNATQEKKNDLRNQIEMYKKNLW